MPSKESVIAALCFVCVGCASESELRGGGTVTVFERTVKWSAPKSYLPERMWHKSSGLYRAVWTGTEGPRLVVLNQSPQDLFGKVYHVAVVADDGRTIRRGTIVCQEFENPYCLVEVNTSSDNAPTVARGQWILGIGLWNKEHELNPDLPIVLDDGGNLARSADEHAFHNVVKIEPVRWADEADWRGGVRVLYHSAFSSRPAEPAAAWPISQ